MATLAHNLDFLGGIEGLIAANDRLNTAVVERIIETQELVMLNNFAIESTEFQFKNSLQSRIAEVESWRYVLKDLVERLKNTKSYLQHEHKALRVVVQRIQKEIEMNSAGVTYPGELMNPTTKNLDVVEMAISEERKFLKMQKTKFQDLIEFLEKQIKFIENTRKTIENDILNKEKTVTVDEECGKDKEKFSSNAFSDKKKAKKKRSSYDRWETRCKELKEKGLQELSKTILLRQQLRGARIELTIKSQAYATRVDAVLRRRLHANQVRLQELAWQRDEATRDHKTLEEELLTTQKTIVDNMEQERIVEMRLIERNRKPAKERIRDHVEIKLKEELARLRRFMKDLRDNLRRITLLQEALVSLIFKIDSAGTDIHQVIRLDEERIRNRMAAEKPREKRSGNGKPATQAQPKHVNESGDSKKSQIQKGHGADAKKRVQKHSRANDGHTSPGREFCIRQLETITEEKEEQMIEGNNLDEHDDYPFDF